jgi:trimethylamine--corrinoid protein Co-methyltransferase
MSILSINGRNVAGALFERLSTEQVRRLHNASLEILMRTGVRLYYAEAVDLLKKAGAFVSEGNRVRIPVGLVEKAFTTVPKRVTLYDRNGKPAIFAEESCCYYGPGSDCLHIVDHRTGARRDPVLNDVVQAMQVCHGLPQVDFVMSMFLPVDVNPLVSDRYQMEVMLNTTTKPIIYVTNEFSGTVDSVEMAEIVAGGAETLRQRPNIANYINVTTGLRHNEEALQKLLFLAEKGLPALYIPVVLGGASGPITQPGAVAMVYAGVLAGLVLSQLKREGAPYIVPGWGGAALDMKILISPYCTPNSGSTAQALAHAYRLPMFGLAGCSDSKVVDQQAAAEAALTLMSETLGGANLIHDLGYLESGLSGSLAQLAICDEIVSWIQACLAPTVIDAETVPLDLIDAIGPDGQWLGADHTRRHMREQWYPTLFDRGNFDQWQARGGQTLGERAADRVTKLLAAYKLEPLPEPVRQAVHAVVERAETRLENQFPSRALKDIPGSERSFSG